MANFVRGRGNIPIVLMEAAGHVDSGKIYIKRTMKFNGAELIDELREILARYTVDMCLHFVDHYRAMLRQGYEQSGEATFYPRRTPPDSELDIHQTLKDQFDLLRVVDNERYPAFFYMRGRKYILKIYPG